MSLSRRQFLKGAGLATAGLGATRLLSACGGSGGVLEDIARLPQIQQVENPFQHGVASGDPLSDAVILWTRVTREDGKPVGLRVTVYADADLEEALASSVGIAKGKGDHTLKIDFGGLDANTTYYYRFDTLNLTDTETGRRFVSAVGRTKTAPAADDDTVERLRFGIASCASYPHGFFNAYESMSVRDLDAVIVLGDYYYEYPGREGMIDNEPEGEGCNDHDYGDGTAIGRIPRPEREIVSLADYRERHALYKEDAQLQELHRLFPFITVWDDHETADNSYEGGADNHDRDVEGDWFVRRGVATQAYSEWMPIRSVGRFDNPRLFRRFRFGRLVDMTVLDTRIAGRTPQTSVSGLERSDPAQAILSPKQENWLYDQLVDAQQGGATWKLLAQQVMLAQVSATLDAEHPDADRVIFEDVWDGYARSRDRLFNFLRTGEKSFANGKRSQTGVEGIEDFVVLTGDIHTSWANDLHEDPYFGGGFRNEGSTDYRPPAGRYEALADPGERNALGVEFVTHSVTASGVPALAEISPAVRGHSPHLRYIDLENRGYTVIDVTPEAVTCFWYVSATILSVDPTEYFAKAFRVERGRPGVVDVTTEVADEAGAPPLPEGTTTVQAQGTAVESTQPPCP